MNKMVPCAFGLCLLCALVFGTVFLKSSWVARGSSTFIVPDEYSTIQEAVNNAVDGDTILVSAGTYYEHVTINKSISLVGENAETTIIDGNNTGHTVHILSDYVNVTGFTVQNSGSTHMPYLDAGFCLNCTVGCTISGNCAVNNDFAGISLLYSSQNIITYNNLSGTGWGGIHLMGSSHNVVSGNRIADKYGGINGHASSHYNNITENIISNCTYGTFYNTANHNNICRNNITTISIEGIWLQEQVNYNTVADNTIINNTVAIRLHGPNLNNTLSGNLITGSEYGIKIESGSRYTRITGNVIMDNRAGNDSWSAGIRLDSGMDSQIDSNVITGNNYGILLYTSSPRVSVRGNNITENEFGLRVASGGSYNLRLIGNVIADNVGYGVGLTGFGSSSNYATVSFNTIVNNSNGVALGQYSNFNTVSRNNISLNDCGFYIEYSTQNLIHGNNVMNNSQQTYVTLGSSNTWDDGYPSGGNYWSDYSGVDLFMGSDQNVSSSDGIGDSPYDTGDPAGDRYPLMGPMNSFNAGTFVGVTYYADVVSNSTISDFYFDPSEGAFIRFNVTEEDDANGFCRVVIPESLLWTEDGWTITADGQPITGYPVISSRNYTYIYFAYSHGTEVVVIQGTHVIPELQRFLILPMFMITLLAVIFHKSKHIHNNRR
jgi:parallel beta-helix repeat protein